MIDMKKRHVFVRNYEEPGPWFHCGEMPPVVTTQTTLVVLGAIHESRAELMKAIGDMVLNEIDSDMGGTDSDVFRMEVKVKEMTGAEVEAMPED